MSAHTNEKESTIFADPESDVENEVPPQYAVILLNDDYTTMEFVIDVLVRFFHKSSVDAQQIMLRVHKEGRGVAGIYSFEIAETKAHQVYGYAQSSGFPLRCAVEPT
jgi:ATP-dependent Clp protease adaptor protein ClpS